MTGAVSLDRGPAKTFHAEQAILWVRFLIIAFNIVLYYGFMDRAGTWPRLAAAVSVAAGSYAVIMVSLRPYRSNPLLLTSWFTAATDSVLVFAWLLATGGIESPFSALWIISLIAIAFRFGPVPTIASTAVYLVAYVGMLAAAGDLGAPLADILAGAAYIGFGGALGALLTRDSMAAYAARENALLRVEDERRRAEVASLEEERWRTISEASLEGVAVHRDGVVLECNPALARILGRSREEVVGLDVRTIMAPESLETLQERLQQPSEDPYELVVLRPDGSRRIVEVKARPVEFHGGPARVTSVRDLTEQRAAEAARDTARQQEQEIARLHDMDAFKTQFINTAAHELNTPITPLMLQMHMLQEQLRGTELRGGAQALAMLDRNLRRLSRLVGDLLDVARLDSGTLRFEPVPMDIAKAVADEAANYRVLAQDAGLEWAQDIPDSLTGVADPLRFTQVVANLLSNAIKFTPHGGIRISVRQEGEEAIITISDDGLGLTAEQQKALFQPFVRLHPQTTAAGTGLGLFISRTIAQRMGGDIACHSDGPGKGTTFTLRFPLQGAPTLEPAHENAS